MKRKRFTEAQIVFALRQAESGTPVAQIIRKMQVSEPTFYRWKKKYAGRACSPERSDHLGDGDLFAGLYRRSATMG